MPDEWAEDLGDTEEVRPGHEVHAGQIGMFN
jgi:hypothetical protein